MREDNSPVTLTLNKVKGKGLRMTHSKKKLFEGV